MQLYHEGRAGRPYADHRHIFLYHVSSQHTEGVTASGNLKSECKVDKKKMNNPINKLGQRFQQTFHKERYK